MVGLGLMGTGLSERLLKAGHRVVGCDLDPNAAQEAVALGVSASTSLSDLVRALPSPRVVWLMVPPGAPIDGVIGELTGLLEPGDVVVDGTNSEVADSVRRAGMLAERGVHLLDVGISGGQWGREEGYCVMVGGERAVADRLTPIFAALAPEGGHLYVGPSGAGHYAKWILVGIVHAMVRAYIEGLELAQASPLVTAGWDELARAWNRAGISRSWALDKLVAAQEHGIVDALDRAPLDTIKKRWSVVGQSGYRCTVECFQHGVSPLVMAATAQAVLSYDQADALSFAMRLYVGYLLESGGIRRGDHLLEYLGPIQTPGGTAADG